jgi:hypothetical protein
MRTSEPRMTPASESASRNSVVRASGCTAAVAGLCTCEYPRPDIASEHRWARGPRGRGVDVRASPEYCAAANHPGIGSRAEDRPLRSRRRRPRPAPRAGARRRTPPERIPRGARALRGRYIPPSRGCPARTSRRMPERAGARPRTLAWCSTVEAGDRFVERSEVRTEQGPADCRRFEDTAEVANELNQSRHEITVASRVAHPPFAPTRRRHRLHTSRPGGRQRDAGQPRSRGDLSVAGRRIESISSPTSCSPLTRHFASSRWPLSSRPAIPCALDSSRAP